MQNDGVPMARYAVLDVDGTLVDSNYRPAAAAGAVEVFDSLPDVLADLKRLLALATSPGPAASSLS